MQVTEHVQDVLLRSRAAVLHVFMAENCEMHGLNLSALIHRQKN